MKTVAGYHDDGRRHSYKRHNRAGTGTESLEARHFGSLPVVDENGCLTGIVTGNRT